MNNETQTPAPEPTLERAARLMAETMPLFRRKALPPVHYGRCPPSPVHMAVLSLLADHGPLTMGQLATMLHTTKPNITKLVDRLETAGLAERRQRTGDRRVVEIAQTRKAIAHRREISRRTQKYMETLLSSLDPGRLDRLAAALETIHEVLGGLNDSDRLIR
jgi:DNA-binding MarR family transcriptional regulator